MTISPENMTHGTRGVFDAAVRMMMQRKNVQLDVEHVFLAMTDAPDSPVSQIFDNLEVDTEELRSDLSRLLDAKPIGIGQTRGGQQHVYITPRAQKCRQQSPIDPTKDVSRRPCEYGSSVDCHR